MKVFVTPPMLQGQDDWSFARLLREAGHEVCYTGENCQLTEEMAVRILPAAEAVVAGSEPYSRRVLDACPGLKVIARAGVGYDAVDMPAATQRGIVVTITPGQNHDAVADLTMALLLALARDLFELHRAVTSGVWKRAVVESPRHSVLGIMGLGRIGQAVALRALPFGFRRLLAYDPQPSRPFAESHGVELVDRDELLRTSDFVTLHVPLMPETMHLIRSETIRTMKDGACLVNTARGGLVDEAALAEALRSGKLRGAGIDVFEQEPPDGSPLLSLPNVICTSHVAGLDLASLQGMAQMASQSVVTLLGGGWPQEGVVNPEAKWRYRGPVRVSSH
ncbi:MAG: phosphoglycerate dehydrogenase [Planctomycetes bacterium]|nr:phosphoglycerate dehydrogenase [Planctomycetota bacterium]